MSGRIGTCAQCGQRYDIPDSVTALQVKCRDCGGTVDIPPSAAAPPPPAAPPKKERKPAKADKKGEKKADRKAKPIAQPLGKPKAAAPRPTEAKAVDREKTQVPKKPVVAPKAAAKPVAPVKPVVPSKKPVVPPKPVAKPVKPVKPVVPPKKAAAPPPKPVVPVQKPAPPKPPAAKPAPPKPAPPKPAPPKLAAPKPAAPKPAAAASAEKKSSAADIIAKAKAKREAEAKAAASKPAPAAKPAAKPAPKPEAKASAADIIAKAKAKREAQGATPAAAKPAPAKPAARQAPAAGGGRPKVQATGGGRAARLKEDLAKPKSKAPMIVGSVVVLILVGVSAWAVFLKKDPPPAPVEDQTAQAPDQGQGGGIPTPAAGSGGAPANASAETTTPPPAGGDTVPAGGDAAPAGEEGGAPAGEDGGGEAADPEPTPKPTPAGVTDWSAPEAGGTISYRGITDPAIIVLTEVPKLGPPPGTADELWSEVVEDLGLYLEDSGAMSNRAGRRLVDDYPREAFPAIVNAMLALDYAENDAHRIGAGLNDLLSDIGKGTNFGWSTVATEESGSDAWNKAAVGNKKVVCAWYNKWVTSWAEDDAAWAAFTKSAVEEQPAAGSGGIVGPDEDL